jgi:hypothetical protein
MSQAMVEDASQPPESSLAVATSETARQRQKIAALEEKLQVLESGHAVKQRYERHLHLVHFVHYDLQGNQLLHVERKSHKTHRNVV